MTYASLRADTRTLPLPAESVDLICTSPPYWAQRAYTDGGETYAGQLGSEDTPALYVEALLDATAEWCRVLKPTGSLWVNLGDKYATRWGSSRPQGRRGFDKDSRGRGRWGRNSTGVPEKSLVGLPWRYALGCIDELGLTLRAEVVWSKPNGLPESVTDRVRRSHEQWFHFTLQPRYYTAVDAIREAYAPGTAARYAAGYGDRSGYDAARQSVNLSLGGDEWKENRLGRLPGSVWSIPTEPLDLPGHLTEDDDHYASFPSELPRRIIAGWSPERVCVVCGQGRRPLLDSVRTFDGEPAGAGAGSIWGDGGRIKTRNGGIGNWRFGTDRRIAGEVCDCTPFTDHPGTGEPSPTAGPDGRQGVRPADIGARHRRVGPWREYHPWAPPEAIPGVVLDPLGGSGTTAHVAHALGRTGLSVDRSAGYARIAADDTLARRRWAKVHDVPAPAWTAPDDLMLFE